MIQPSILPEHTRSPAIRSFSPAGMWRFLDSATPCRWLPKLRRHWPKNDEEHAAITATLVDALQYSTMDAELLAMLADGHRLVVTLEDGQLEGGWGEKVTAFYANSSNANASRVRVLNFGAAKEFTDRVPLGELNERYGLTSETIVSRIRGILSE